MFTGIIEGLGQLKRIRSTGHGREFVIHPDFDLTQPLEGESIAVNGVCLTATAIDIRSFTVDVSPETLSRSTLGLLSVGDKLNIERALRLSDRLGGHLVSGHVDCVGRITGKKTQSRFTLFSISIPQRYDRYLVEKGSVAVDGISLTVNSCSNGNFTLAIIPHTLRITTLGLRSVGDKVNIELDLVGKYIEKLLKGSGKEEGRKLDKDFLAKYDFI